MKFWIFAQSESLEGLLGVRFKCSIIGKIDINSAYKSGVKNPICNFNFVNVIRASLLFPCPAYDRNCAKSLKKD